MTWQVRGPAVSIITPAWVTTEAEVLWFREAIKSVINQTRSDWEMVIVDDGSPRGIAGIMQEFGDPRLRCFTCSRKGVSAARNRAAQEAQSPLLLPLDADDKLAPLAVETFLGAWETREKASVLYSDTVSFTESTKRRLRAPDYDFDEMLTRPFMLIGCLHLRADWKRVGGWREDMRTGLEDWEYWIRFGKQGLCGQRVPELLYWYRKRPDGRTANAKANSEAWNNAVEFIRELHADVYDGRYPVGCCGGNTRRMRSARRQTIEALPLQEDREPVVYTGNRDGEFWVKGRVTRTRYLVIGRGVVLVAKDGTRGVDPRDVPSIVRLGDGTIFKVERQRRRSGSVSEDQPRHIETWISGSGDEPSPLPPPPRVEAVGSKSLADIDPNAFTVREVRRMDLTASEARVMLVAEQAGKNRKGVVAHLTKLVDAASQADS